MDDTTSLNNEATPINSADKIPDFESQALAYGKKIADLQNQVNDLANTISTLEHGTVIYKLRIDNLTDQIAGSDTISDMLVTTVEDLDASNQKLKELSSRLEGHQKTLVEILFSVAHDLQTPLNGLIGNLEMFAETIRSSINEELFTKINSLALGQVMNQDVLDGFQESIAKITRNLTTIERLQRTATNLYQQVGSLLEDVSIQKGQITLDVDNDPTQISTLVEDLTTSNSVSAKKKNITIGFEYGNIEGFYTNYILINRIINNLINNAIKNTKSTVKVSMTKETYDGKDYVEIKVSDNGRGILAKDLPYIGEALFRTENSLKGTGFGLSSVKSLAGLMGGDMEVYSAGAGQGATFTVKVLLDQRQAQV